MHIHEFQTKELLRNYGIAVPPFAVISSLMDLEEALEKLNLSKAVLKVQIHAGGRGKAGGVKLAFSPQEIRSHAKNMIGMQIINEQTGQEGIIAHKLLLSPLLEYSQEYYLGAVIDRKLGKAQLIASASGGVNIEEIAAKSPERILRIPIENQGKVRSYHLYEMLKFMGWLGVLQEQATSIIKGLAKAFWDYDASLLEINPLVSTDQGNLIALDAKLSVDDNALYRQPLLADFFDPTQLSPYEVADNPVTND